MSLLASHKRKRISYTNKFLALKICHGCDRQSYEPKIKSNFPNPFSGAFQFQMSPNFLGTVVYSILLFLKSAIVFSPQKGFKIQYLHEIVYLNIYSYTRTIYGITIKLQKQLLLLEKNFADDTFKRFLVNIKYRQHRLYCDLFDHVTFLVLRPILNVGLVILVCDAIEVSHFQLEGFDNRRRFWYRPKQ